MTRIRIKRVYEPEAPEDGYRVLVDKLWPRGIRKEALRYDVWAKEIAPTPGLRAWFHAAPAERWEEFRRRYTGELRSSPAVCDFVRRIAGKDTVTLLYASKNAAGNHALILQEYLAHGCGRGYKRPLLVMRVSSCPGSARWAVVSCLVSLWIPGGGHGSSVRATVRVRYG